MKSVTGQLRLLSTRAFEWWTKPEADLSPDVRRRLRQATFGKRISVYFGSICVCLLSATAFYRTGSLWPLVWLAAEAVLTGTRLTVMHACEQASANGRDGPVWPLMPLGGLWSMIFGIGCAACLASDIAVLAVVAGLSVAAIVVSTSSRNAATPRFAIFCMAAVSAPWTIMAFLSPAEDMTLAGVQAPILLLGMIAVLYQNHRDLVRLVEAEQHSRALARTDALTGLPNRTVLVECMGDLCKATANGASSAPFTILSVDLDGFKSINDQHGHAAGDRLLARAAERIQRAVREGDIVCRTGGDEFVVVMPRTTKEQADLVARRIIEKVSNPYRFADGTTLVIGASIGSAEAPLHATTVAALLAHSDEALYTAKRSGRGRHVRAAPVGTLQVLQTGLQGVKSG